MPSVYVVAVSAARRPAGVTESCWKRDVRRTASVVYCFCLLRLALTLDISSDGRSSSV
jgi:hypothetical protein